MRLTLIGRLAKKAKSLLSGFVGAHPFNLGFYGLALVSAIILLASSPVSPLVQDSNRQQVDQVSARPETKTETDQRARESTSGNQEISFPGSDRDNDPFAASKWEATPKRVPILMYHYIRANPDPSDTIGLGLSVTPAEFERQVRYLVDNGYQIIGLTELVHAINNNVSLPQRSVVLTFDDGYLDFYQNAYPILKRYNAKATSFVITNFVGRKGYLTWGAILEMATSGLITIGSHTLGHADLTREPVAVAAREIKESKRLLEEQLGVHVTLFSYPGGQYNAAVMKLVEEAGYVAAVSTRHGNIHARDDIFRLKRIRIDGREKQDGFIARLRYVDLGTADVPSTPTITPSPTSVLKALLTPTPIPTPGNDVIVPNVVGLPEAEAQRRLNAAGLEVSYTNYQAVEDVAPDSKQYFLSIPSGSVVSQQPAPGAILKRGEKVHLAVRKK